MISPRPTFPPPPWRIGLFLRLTHLITEEQAMHFIILGAGAIGCYVGARLASAGQQVTLVGHPRVLQPLAQDGLQVSDLDGFSARVPPASLQLAQSLAEVNLQPPCVVLLCVKGGATESAARDMAVACVAGTPVISLQNGVDNVARLQAAAPQLQALAGMVPYNVVMPKANAVHRATTEQTFSPEHGVLAHAHVERHVADLCVGECEGVEEFTRRALGKAFGVRRERARRGHAIR